MRCMKIDLKTLKKRNKILMEKEKEKEEATRKWSVKDKKEKKESIIKVKKIMMKATQIK